MSPAPPGVGALLLRNYLDYHGVVGVRSGDSEDETRVDLNEVEAEGLSTFAQAEEGALSVALVIDRGGLIAVWRAVAEHAEDNDGELTGRWQ